MNTSKNTDDKIKVHRIFNINELKIYDNGDNFFF